MLLTIPKEDKESPESTTTLSNKEKAAAGIPRTDHPLCKMRCTTSAPGGSQSVIDSKYVVNGRSKGKEKMVPMPVVCLHVNART